MEITTTDKMKSLLKWDSLPTYDLKGRMGGTDYIDVIGSHEVSQICKGIDRYQRPFICLPVTSKAKGDSVLVLFQRYTDDEYTWVVGERGCKTQMLGYEMREEHEKNNLPFHIVKGGSLIVDFDKLKLLLEGKHHDLCLRTENLNVSQ